MHSWFKYCINPSAYQKVISLKDFMKVMRKQANDNSALVPYRESLRFEDYDEDGEFTGHIKAPRYFGAAVEALSETYFEVFGSEYNLAGYKSIDDIDEDLEDTGYDATAYTAKKKVYKGTITKIAEPGNRVYVQVKGALNKVKEFTTNDGSRIMNFYGNAQGHARMLGQGNRARFILFTTAAGLHYKLNNNTFKEIEVVHFTAISKKVDKNPVFWNAFFDKLGINNILVEGPHDPEYDSIIKELDILKD
jgi:hypothetical protein